MTAILRQAGAVLIGERAILIEGPPGSGKSSLALALIDRGALLIGDDGVTLEARGSGSGEQRLWATPPPTIGGMIEIRGVGLVSCPVGEGQVALILRLDQNAPRLPDTPRALEIAGCPIPLLLLHPSSPVLHLRAERALEMHGLR